MPCLYTPFRIMASHLGVHASITCCGAHYDSSQQHWVHALLGKCPLLPTAKIALETQRVQEGIYFSERLGREVTADEIETLSVSKALEIPNLAL